VASTVLITSRRRTNIHIRTTQATEARMSKSQPMDMSKPRQRFLTGISFSCFTLFSVWCPRAERSRISRWGVPIAPSTCKSCAGGNGVAYAHS
jgi:hypothetical protein